MTNGCVLLILCGGIEAVPAIISAHRAGIRTVVVDGDPDAPAKKFADHFFQASIYHHEQVIDALSPHWDQLGVSGITTVAADNSMTVARVGLHFGLAAQSPKTAQLATNKVAMKVALKEAGVLIPWFAEVHSLSELQLIISHRVGNYVLKPIDSRGSRGVIRVNSKSDISFAYHYAKSYTNSETLILEEWLMGDQLSSESIVWQGKTYLCGLADRNYSRLDEIFPYVVEDGGETPSRHSSAATEKSINTLMDEICKLIGLEHGSIKGDLILHRGEIYVVEFATRLSGGSFSTLTIPLVYNYDLVTNVFKIALGQTPDLPPHPLVVHNYQANRFLFPPEGIVDDIQLTNKTILNDLIDYRLDIEVGDHLFGAKNHTMRPAWALASGATRDEAIKRATDFIESIHIAVKE